MNKQPVPAKNIDGIRPRTAAKPAPKKVGRMQALRDRWLWATLGGGLALVALAGGLALLHHHRAAADSNNYKVVMAEVAHHYVLPTDETPALATVTDKSKLTTPFFKHTQNGDKILIYQKNQLAIIYRPSLDRIIAVGPVSIDTPTKPQGSN